MEKDGHFVATNHSPTKHGVNVPEVSAELGWGGEKRGHTQ